MAPTTIEPKQADDEWHALAQDWRCPRHRTRVHVLPRSKAFFLWTHGGALAQLVTLRAPACPATRTTRCVTRLSANRFPKFPKQKKIHGMLITHSHVRTDSFVYNLRVLKFCVGFWPIRRLHNPGSYKGGGGGGREGLLQTLLSSRSSPRVGHSHIEPVLYIQRDPMPMFDTGQCPVGNNNYDGLEQRHCPRSIWYQLNKVRRKNQSSW